MIADDAAQVPAATDVGNPALNITIFAIFVAITLVIVFRASPQQPDARPTTTPAAASFTGPQNGIAHLRRLPVRRAASSASRARSRSTGTTASSTRSASSSPGWSPCCWSPSCCATPAGSPWPTCCRFRLRQRPVRMAAAISHPRRLALLPAGPDGRRRRPGRAAARRRRQAGQSLVIAVVGILMITYVLVGGMKGTTWVQIIKAVLLIIGAGVMTVWVLGKYGFNLSDPARRRRRQGRRARERALLDPGKQYGATEHDQARLHLAGAGPGPRHRRPAARADALLHRALGPSEARRSVGVGDLADRHLLPVHPGPRLRRRRAGRPGRRSRPRPGKANSAAPLLAFELGGTVLLGVISAVAFATILAVVAGLTITASAVVRARRLRQRDQAGPGQRRTARSGSPGSRPS